jgi:putative ABC transport system permease protein
VVREIDPAVPGYGIARLGDLVDARLSQERMLNLLSLLFAALALMVASAGLYGRVVHSVVRRRREIGIRLAVGAPRQSIVGLFTADVLRLVALGVVIGVPLALLVGRRFSAVLYNVEPGSLSSLSVAAAVLGAVSVLAVVVPAARAARLDPTATLREP